MQVVQRPRTLTERILEGKQTELRQLQTCHSRCLYCRRETECATHAEELRASISWMQCRLAQQEATR